MHHKAIYKLYKDVKKIKETKTGPVAYDVAGEEVKIDMDIVAIEVAKYKAEAVRNAGKQRLNEIAKQAILTLVGDEHDQRNMLARFAVLQRKEANGTISDTEIAELDALENKYNEVEKVLSECRDAKAKL